MNVTRREIVSDSVTGQEGERGCIVCYGGQDRERERDNVSLDE